jgi:hypothetical protein
MLGYKFANPALLMQALTHSSCSHSRLRSQSYDRLEFLGDAVLDVVAADAALQHSQVGALVRSCVCCSHVVGSLAELAFCAYQLSFAQHINRVLSACLSALW